MKEKIKKLLGSMQVENFLLVQEIIKGDPIIRELYNEWVDSKAIEFSNSRLFELVTYKDGDAHILNNHILHNMDYSRLKDNVYDLNGVHCKSSDNPLCMLQGNRHKIVGYSMNIIEDVIKLLFHIEAWGETFKVDLKAFEDDFFIGYRLKTDIR